MRLRRAGLALALVVLLDTFLSALGRGWALVEAEAELVLSDGTADVEWYRLELVKAGGAWKVADVQPAAPRLSGVGLPIWGETAAKARVVFQEYLSLLARSEYGKAAKLCVGRARAMQERQAPYLDKAPLVKEVGEVSARSLWRRGKYLVLLAEYKADGRPVMVVVLMCRTGQGWRIVGVRQS